MTVLCSTSLPPGFKLSGITRVISDTHFGHDHMLKYSRVRLAISRARISNIHDLDGVEWVAGDEDPRVGEVTRDDFDNYWKVDEMIVSRWKGTVKGVNDLVIHLGDFASDDVPEQEILAKSRSLRGRKLLVKGNHDPGDTSVFERCGWHVITKPTLAVAGLCIELDLDRFKYPPRDVGCIVADIEGTRVMFSHVPAFYDPSLYEELPQDQTRFRDTCSVLQDIFTRCECAINIHGHIHGRRPPERSVNASVERINFTPATIRDLIRSYEAGST
ncbi:MAG: metallophosphoesterase [Candidatus Lokiarchaeota archaeon]|nr:metallophosphoesterase [Candidatus Lokiarchaeota archaeon]